MKELREVPFADLLEIKRCNLEQLKKVSSGVRLLPEVVKAAKSMPEKQFVEKLNREHDQHLETSRPVVMAPGEVCTIFEQAVDRVIVFYGCTRAEALEHIGERDSGEVSYRASGGSRMKQPDIECGVFCLLAEKEIG